MIGFPCVHTLVGPSTTVHPCAECTVLVLSLYFAYCYRKSTIRALDPRMRGDNYEYPAIRALLNDIPHLQYMDVDIWS
jgi:hypothetical protein